MTGSAYNSMPMNMAIKLEDSLQAAGFSREDVEEAKRFSRQGHTGLTEGLLKRNVLGEQDLLVLIGEIYGIPFRPDLSADHLDLDYTGKTPIQYLKKFKVVPLISSAGAAIAVHDPSNFQIIDDLIHLLDLHNAENSQRSQSSRDTRHIQIVLSTQAAIQGAINLAYDRSRNTAREFVEEMNGETPDSIISEIEETVDLLDETSDAPIIKLVNLLLSGAVKDRASDIHIEPYQGNVKVRYRIDGILYNILGLPRRTQSPLVSRIKIMASLNIAEKRLPQDGRIEIKVADRSVDIRVSVIPTAFGERVVMRLLDKTASILDLFDLGMNRQNVALFNKLIKSPYGIILVTGPTGSGKTTTLYAALSSINQPEINIITIEDPIEYQIEGIGQIQVNPKIDLTFAQGLRSIVRQDPDVILIGEIRDRETAEIAIQSSLTGHMVFSTLHTNDAASAVTRLIDMGIEPFLVTSSVIAIVAQRLVRVLCMKCREAYVPDDESLANMGIERSLIEGGHLYRKKGCLACMNTGYWGRTAIFELMIMEDAIKMMILRTSDSNQINDLAIRQGMKTLLQDGADKVLKGITTIEEVFRVTRILKRESDITQAI